MKQYKFIKLFLSFTSRTITLIVCGITLASIFAAYVSPSIFWPLALLGLAFPIFMILNIILLSVWLFRKRWFALVPLMICITGFPQIQHSFAWHIVPKKNETNAIELKVMTYNVRNFDLYNWSHNTDSKNKIYQTILQENPDILCLQEFYTDTSKNFNNIKQLEDLGYKYHLFSKELTLRKYEHWGLAIFSKMPFKENGFFMKAKNSTVYGFYPNKGLFADIDFDGREVRIVNTHLQSIYLQQEDYEAIINVKKEKDMNSLQKATSIIFKLRKAFERRADQSLELKMFTSSQKKPIIICGDFNDTPHSFAYYQASHSLRDSFTEGGWGIGNTYNGPIPGLRIDYILHHTDLEVIETKVLKNPISDHFPVVTRMIWEEEE
ncbi:MAG: endonuclease/exonuclease/phosphatase family protein [Chitinophagales bacterium]|nr:endonuclease/exonuclease/phosphatase family protein [Chitinophagales bacterium]